MIWRGILVLLVETKLCTLIHIKIIYIAVHFITVVLGDEQTFLPVQQKTNIPNLRSKIISNKDGR